MIAAGPIVYPLRPGSVWGGEVYELELLPRLPALGVQLLLGLPRAHGFAPAPEGVEVAALRHSPALHWTRAPLVFVPWLRSVLTEREIGVLRGQSVRFAGPSLLAARRLARRPDIPIVLHHHHPDPRWAKLEGRIAAHADAVITVSEWSRGELVAAGVDSERIHVVPDGVAGPGEAPAAAPDWPGDGLRLLCLGRLETRKRPELALRALAAYDGPAGLVIAGDGAERGALERLAQELGIAERVRFTGRVGEAEKWGLYSAADVLLFCSGLEGFGLVAAEALSSGTPVIATRGTATAEVVRDGETGLLADADPGSLATAIAAFAVPELLTSMGDAAAADAAERFNWDAHASAVAAIYATVRAGG